MIDKVCVAVVQAAPVFFDKKATLSKIADLIGQAVANGAEIVLFPESFIPGHPRSLNIGSTNDHHLKKEREFFRRFYENAIHEDDREIGWLAELAKKNKVYLSMGLTERDRGGLFSSVFFWSPDGRFLGKHRKLKPTGFERLLWSQGDGSILTTLDTPYGKMGSVICWENYMPLLRATMYAKGVGLYLAPAADAHPHWQSTIRHIALEGRCFVLSANQFLTSSMLPEGLAELAAKRTNMMHRGGSAIISPSGEYLAGPIYGQEGILTAELDLSLITETHYDFDPLGPSIRQDIFTLIVNEAPRNGTEFTGCENETH